MPRLIHLNGPPGIGKSTIAQRYVDERPGVLNLDIDQVRTLIGGWRERFAETGEIVRPVALSMAATHLRGGRDVVIPQFLGRLSEVERFEAVARDNGAVFCAVVLMDDKQRCIERFNRRGEGGEIPGTGRYSRSSGFWAARRLSPTCMTSSSPWWRQGLMPRSCSAWRGRFSRPTRR